VLFVPEMKRVSDIFHEIQRQSIAMVVVVDEYGHTAGIITKEDLVEEIVGEIYDEYEAEQAPIIKLGPGRFLVGGLVAASDLAEEVGIRLETEAVTVNGMLAEILGRIPRAGETVEHHGLMFQVGEVRRHRVVRCVVRVIEGDAESVAGEPGEEPADLQRDEGAGSEAEYRNGGGGRNGAGNHEGEPWEPSS
jgi:CBS domain containing-hemolysin-like protein